MILKALERKISLLWPLEHFRSHGIRRELVEEGKAYYLKPHEFRLPWRKRTYHGERIRHCASMSRVKLGISDFDPLNPTSKTEQPSNIRNTTKEHIEHSNIKEITSAGDRFQPRDQISGQVIPAQLHLGVTDNGSGGAQKHEGGQEAASLMTPAGRSRDSPVTKFPKFGKLSIETCLNIWQVLLQQP
jgi:hypothetical protein